MDGLLLDLRDNVSITVYFDFAYSGLHRCIVFFLSSVSLLHYLAIQPSRLQSLQGCCNKISCCQLLHYCLNSSRISFVIPLQLNVQLISCSTWGQQTKFLVVGSLLRDWYYAAARDLQSLLKIARKSYVTLWMAPVGTLTLSDLESELFRFRPL